MEPPTVGWALLHQSVIRTVPQICHRPPTSWSLFFWESLLFCVKLVANVTRRECCDFYGTAWLFPGFATWSTRVRERETEGPGGCLPISSVTCLMSVWNSSVEPSVVEFSSHLSYNSDSWGLTHCVAQDSLELLVFPSWSFCLHLLSARLQTYIIISSSRQKF